MSMNKWKQHVKSGGSAYVLRVRNSNFLVDLFMNL